jgi:uncharacterized protein YjbI with pentapeptide repeats
MDQELYQQITTPSGKQPLSVVIPGGDLANAELRGRDLQEFQFSNVDFSGAHLDGAIISHADSCVFDGATMTDLRPNILPTSSWSLLNCKFRNADLEGANLSYANIANSDFSGANLKRCILQYATFHPNCVLAGADVEGASVRDTAIYPNFMQAENLAATKHLDRVNSFVRLFDLDALKLDPVDRFASWDRIRAFGQLPLFGLSYGTIAALLAIFGWAAVYNSALARLATMPRTDNVVAALFGTLQPYSVPLIDWCILISALCLAFASTVYRVRCPPRVKENTISYWTDTLEKPPLHYMALAWADRGWRLISGITYLIGAFVALCVAVYKLVEVVDFMWSNTLPPW